MFCKNFRAFFCLALLASPLFGARVYRAMENEPVVPNRLLVRVKGGARSAAVLSRLALHVYTIERNPALADRARAVLASENLRNITVRTGDGFAGWPDQAPFDRIIVTAAPEDVPAILFEQLKPRGKLVAPVGRTPENQELTLFERDMRGRVSRRSAGPVRFVPMLPGISR